MAREQGHTPSSKTEKAQTTLLLGRTNHLPGNRRRFSLPPEEELTAMGDKFIEHTSGDGKERKSEAINPLKNESDKLNFLRIRECFTQSSANMSSSEVDESKRQYGEGRLADRGPLTTSVRALYGATYV
ncbi:hypothetical protein Dimus_036785 [Dionaea muscipula]